MKATIKIGLGVVLACAVVSQACAWSVKKSNKTKTHVQVLVVDEDRKPVPGQKMSFKLSGGGGRKFTLASDKDGMVSFCDDIGSYAICTFALDRKVHYPVWFEFRPDADGSVVTGVVKRVAKPSGMIHMKIAGQISKEVDRVGLDLLYGELVMPYGKGRHADLYLTCAAHYDKTIEVEPGDEWKQLHAEFGVERADKLCEYTVVPRDVGCALPTPAMAPETMDGGDTRAFIVDKRPGRRSSEHFGDKRYIIFRIVRSQGTFYGVIISGYPWWQGEKRGCEISYRLNPVPGKRDIVWTSEFDYSDAWREKVKGWYAEEDAEKAKKTSGQNKEAVK